MLNEIKDIGDCKCLNKLDKYLISEVLSNEIKNKEKKLERKIIPTLYSDIRRIVDLRNRVEDTPECR